MNNLSQIKKRVSSILHIKKLSKVVKSLAIKKSRVINERLKGLRVYFTQIEELIENYLEGQITTFVESDSGETLNIVFFSDISFSGSLNNKIRNIISKVDPKKNKYIVVGKKNPLSFYPESQVIEHYKEIDEEGELIFIFEEIMEKILDIHAEKQVTKVNIICSFLDDDFLTVSTKHIPFIPLGIAPETRKTHLEIEPSEQEFLNVAIREYLKTCLYYYYYCSKASEYAISKRTAENIERNVEDLLEELQYKYHSVRKQRITQELGNVSSYLDLDE